MARKFFLASVGNAEGYAKEDGVLKRVLSARTLTESTLGFTSSMEEVRAGQGAKLYGRFNHSAGMTVSLTDAMFDLHYITLQTGSKIEDQLGASVMHTDSKTFDYDGSKTTVTLEQDPSEIGVSCGLNYKVAVFRASGCGATAEDVVVIDTPASDTKGSHFAGRQITIGDNDKGNFVNGVSYCVSYYTIESTAELIKIGANFIPKELVLVLTAKLFEGDANAPETGVAAGEITIKIPRFQLDGQFDLSMAMTSAATIALNGTALAVDAGGCNDDGIYAEIVRVIKNLSQKDLGIRMIAIDPEGAKDGATPSVYGLYNDGRTALLNNALLTFNPNLSEAGAYVGASGSATTYTATLKENTALKDTVEIPAKG